MTAAMPTWRDENREVFDATVLTAAEQLGIGPLPVLKDYWVCQALAAVAINFPDDVVFKGGTSIEKLRIIERLSEDIDLLVVARPVGRAGGRLLKAICAQVAEALGQTADEKITSGGKPDTATLYRSVYVRHPTVSQLDGPQGLADPDRVMVELGQSGGDDPTITASIESLLARQLATADVPVAEFSDLAPFTMRVLHPARTLLEKLLRVHTFATQWPDNQTTERKLRIGRQLYDIAALVDNADVQAMLTTSGRRDEILDDCLRVSAQFHGDAPRPDGGFAQSPAFAGQGDLATWLAAGHDQAMRELYFGHAPPSFGQVLDAVHQHATML